jgi:hypothetical protein
VETLPLAFANGWASGISAYAVVLVAGIVGRLGWADTPELLQRTDILVAAGALVAVEFVADKIPYLDSVWDGVHTVVRPLIAAGVGALIAEDAGSTVTGLAAAGTAGIALLSHLSKSGIRLAVNTSPEPATNVGVSSAEDVTVAGVALLAWQYPWVAAVIAAVLLVLGVSAVAYLFSRVRRGWKRLGARLGM